MLKKILFLLVVFLVISHPLQAHKEYNTTVPAPQPAVSDMCVIAAAKMESEHNIKKHLLQTISSVETGRWDYSRDEFISWPWTINVNGKGYRFDTKEEAVARVKQLQAEGISSIDVGCMQINLKYHGDAFASIEDAFDPEKNVEYGAKFLKRLYAKRGSWQRAAMAYHSKILSRGLIYKDKLLSRYEEIKLALLDSNESRTLF